MARALIRVFDLGAFVKKSVFGVQEISRDKRFIKANVGVIGWSVWVRKNIFRTRKISKKAWNWIWGRILIRVLIDSKKILKFA